MIMNALTNHTEELKLTSSSNEEDSTSDSSEDGQLFLFFF